MTCFAFAPHILKTTSASQCDYENSLRIWFSDESNHAYVNSNHVCVNSAESVRVRFMEFGISEPFNSGFTFDLVRMKERVEGDFFRVPSDLSSPDDFDNWLAGLNLE